MNIIPDYHVHTEFSGDCNTPAEELVSRAIELGLKEVIFTDHVDFDYPSKKVLFEINFEEYIKKIESLRDYYKKIDILMGIEIGYQPHLPHLNDRYNKLLNAYPFDFVICSMHAFEDVELDKGDLFRENSQQEGYKIYFENLKKTVENFDNCDVYGHLDFVVRYGNFKNKVLRYEDYKDIIDEILTIIISKGKGIELNTSGLRYKLNSMHPNREILKRYYELGGRIITVGSDAHIAKDFCADFDKAIKELKEIGFKEVTTFKNRKPSFIKI